RTRDGSLLGPAGLERLDLVRRNPRSGSGPGRRRQPRCRPAAGIARGRGGRDPGAGRGSRGRRRRRLRVLRRRAGRGEHEARGADRGAQGAAAGCPCRIAAPGRRGTSFRPRQRRAAERAMTAAAGELFLAEIREQPEALLRLLEHEQEFAAAARAFADRRPTVVRLVGHGTSDAAASYGVYAFGLLPGWTAIRDSI